MDQQTTPPPHQEQPQATASANHSGVHGALGSIEHQLEQLFAKVPFHIPENWRQTIAKISPWITLVLMILALPLILAALGLSLFVTPAAVATGTSLGVGYWIGWVFILASIILEAVALPGLFKRSIKGWRFVFWSYILMVISHIFTFSIGGIVGDIIGLYILFEIKNQYH
jgi:hypothetical protein